MIVLPLSRRNPPPSSATCCVMLYLVYFLSTVTAMVLQSPKPRTASPTSCSSFLGRTYNVNCAPQVTSPPALTAFLVVHPKKERKEATELGQTGIAKNHYEVFLPQEQIDIYAESTSPAAALVVGEPRPKGATSSHLVCRSTVAHHKIHQRSGVVNFEKTLKKWKLRLITREDPFSIHKISSIAYTMSAAIILGTGAIQFFQSPETFSEVPPSLLIPGYIFAISNAVMCCGSTQRCHFKERVLGHSRVFTFFRISLLVDKSLRSRNLQQSTCQPIISNHIHTFKYSLYIGYSCQDP